MMTRSLCILLSLVSVVLGMPLERQLAGQKHFNETTVKVRLKIHYSPALLVADSRSFDPTLPRRGRRLLLIVGATRVPSFKAINTT